MTRKNNTIPDPQGRTLIIERIEDGMVQLEYVADDGDISNETVSEEMLSDNHFHDGMVVEVNDDGLLYPNERESAERERYIKNKIEDIGRRPNEEGK